ncbi:hypothetical protein [Methyloprofundus sp.]|uniref:hypothetical protein n=1 Tax=Methyloprofundus sp. TaxID=2020875 RepID=UPI003D14DAE8
MKFIKISLPVAGFLSIFLASCTQFKESIDYMHLGLVEPIAAKTYVFECSDKFTFTASIGDNQARILYPEQSITLAHAFTLFGQKFNAKQTTLWLEKGIAKLEISSVIHENCHNNKAKATWEDAKLNGVDFRAVGTQSSWILEIVKGKNIIFADFFGKINKYLFSISEPVIDEASRSTVYKTSNDEHTLLVKILGTSCQDIISGETFEFTVTVKLDGKLFKGCGRSLL